MSARLEVVERGQQKYTFFLTRDLSLKDAAFLVAKKAVTSQHNHAHYESSGKFPENQKKHAANE